MYCPFENSNVLFFVILITPLPEEMGGRSIAYQIDLDKDYLVGY